MENLKVDYDYYVDVFEGNTLPSDVFDKVIEDAYLKVANSIRPNAEDIEEDETEIIENIKKCQCELAEFEYENGLVQSVAQPENSSYGVGDVKSETAGSTSRTYVTNLDVYNTRNQEIISNPEKFENKIIQKYLGYTGLLYRGVCHV